MRGARLSTFAVALFVLTLLPIGCEACSPPPRSTTERAPSAALRSQLGTNLDFLVDWSTAMPFVDLMKTSRPWISGTMDDFDGGPPLDLDEHGWIRSLRPGQVARTLMLWEMTTHPAGRYVVIWDGEGELQFEGASAQRLENESLPHRDVLQIDPRRGGGLTLLVTRTDPADPIRNIRVLVPGGACSEDATRFCDASQPCGEAGACRPFEEIADAQVFHPTFLRAMSEYSVIRFMNWADANSTQTQTFEETWSDRTELADARWGPRAPLEVMIDLANRVGAEPWLTLPSRADDDYARRAGALARDRLDPSLRVWVEYSNEVWNTMFPQSAWATERGLALGLSDEAESAMLFYYSRRTGELHRAFGEGMIDGSRMVRVYAGQPASPWRSERILDFEGAAARADVWAIAPYFGHTVQTEERAEWAALSLDEFFARAEGESFDFIREAVGGSAALARERSLSPVAYEGGQHFVGYGEAQTDARITELFAAANRDRRMEPLYDEYLRLWRELGGGLFVHLVDCAAGSRYGNWGASEWLGQPLDASPKRRALLRWARTTRL